MLNDTSMKPPGLIILGLDNTLIYSSGNTPGKFFEGAEKFLTDSAKTNVVLILTSKGTRTSIEQLRRYNENFTFSITPLDNEQVLMHESVNRSKRLLKFYPICLYGLLVPQPTFPIPGTVGRRTSDEATKMSVITHIKREFNFSFTLLIDSNSEMIKLAKDAGILALQVPLTESGVDVVPGFYYYLSHVKKLINYVFKKLSSEEKIHLRFWEKTTSEEKEQYGEAASHYLHYLFAGGDKSLLTGKDKEVLRNENLAIGKIVKEIEKFHKIVPFQKLFGSGREAKAFEW